MTTRNESSASRPHRTAARREAYACDSPWNPYRRTPSSRQAAGIAYVDAASGSVAWNAVSNAATCGTSGQHGADRRDRRQ